MVNHLVQTGHLENRRREMPYFPLEKISALKPGYRKAYRIAGKKLLLLQVEGDTYLIDQRCPHDQASLASGKVAGRCIRCAKHGIAFDLHTGLPQGGAAVADVPPLTFYSLVYKNGEVGVEF
jgi:nitrite reductase/ring-hydroxylating ferredoxin subunit